MDWLDVYCTHCRLTGQTCIVPILDRLASWWMQHYIRVMWHYQGLGWFIYHLGSFFKEILNMMMVKINIAYSMCCFQNSMESEGMNGMNLPNLDDLYIIRCEMTCRWYIWRGLLHIWFVALTMAYLMIMTKNGIVTTSVKHGISYIARPYFSCRFWNWSQNSRIPSVPHVMSSFVLKYVMKDWSHYRTYFNC